MRRFIFNTDAYIENQKEKLTADFNKNAGDDAQLSSDELKILLTSCAPRVGRHRGNDPIKGKVPGESGGHKPMPMPDSSWGEVLKKFDADGDGKLSKEEFDAFLAEKRAEHGK